MKLNDLSRGFTFRSRAEMPGFDGATGWLNTEPLHRADLHGKVVLVDFWTYTCINWLRTLPYIRAWADAYGDKGWSWSACTRPSSASSTTSTTFAARRAPWASSTRSRSTTTTRSGRRSRTSTGPRSTSPTPRAHPAPSVRRRRLRKVGAGHSPAACRRRRGRLAGRAGAGRAARHRVRRRLAQRAIARDLRRLARSEGFASPGRRDRRAARVHGAVAPAPNQWALGAIGPSGAKRQ